MILSHPFQKLQPKIQLVPGGTEYFVCISENDELKNSARLLIISLDLISAGIVLVLAESSGADFPGISLQQREQTWDECLETLNRMIAVHPSARDYCIALDDLRKSHREKLCERKIPQSPAHPCSIFLMLEQISTAAIHPNRSPSDERIPVEPEIEGANQVPSSVMQGDRVEYGLQSPFFGNWDADLGDIMLPAQFLQNLDEELLLPNLF